LLSNKLRSALTMWPKLTSTTTIGVGAHCSVNFRGHKIFARIICIKNQQNARIVHGSYPKNYQNTRIFMIFARKMYKICEFYVIFARKMPEFYIIIVRQIFSPNYRGTRAHMPPSLTPMAATNGLCRNSCSMHCSRPIQLRLHAVGLSIQSLAATPCTNVARHKTWLGIPIPGFRILGSRPIFSIPNPGIGDTFFRPNPGISGLWKWAKWPNFTWYLPEKYFFPEFWWQFSALKPRVNGLDPNTHRFTGATVL